MDIRTAVAELRANYQTHIMHRSTWELRDWCYLRPPPTDWTILDKNDREQAFTSKDILALDWMVTSRVTTHEHTEPRSVYLGYVCRHGYQPRFCDAGCGKAGRL